MANKFKKGKCIIEQCPIKDRIYCRGLCMSHYSLMRNTIQKGKHTWQEFEKYRMALPSATRENPLVGKSFETMLKKRAKK